MFLFRMEFSSVTPVDAIGTVFGDRVSHENTKNDLNSVIAFNEADIRGIHTLATTIVDYRGFRVICQAIIPGILKGEHGSKHVYGSVADSDSFVWDEKHI